MALACGGVIVAAVLAAYGGTLSVPMLFDDHDAILSNQSIRHLGSALVPPTESTVGGRPVLNITLAVNYALGGFSVWGYHAVNLLIHALAALALFGVVRRACAPRGREEACVVALSAALLWSLHPLQTESVTYIVQRAESLMGLLYLLTLYFFIRGAEAEKGRIWFVLSVGACLLGMATKEVMASAPLVVLLYDRAFLGGSLREAWRRRRGVYAALASTWLVLVPLVISTHGRGGTAGLGNGVSPWDYALTQSVAIVHYLRLCLLPWPLVFDYGTALVRGVAAILPCALVVLALVAATAWALVRRPALGFLGAAFFAILAPSFSFVPVATQTMAEHRMYLPLAPLAVLLVLGISRFLGRAALPVCLALAAALAAATWERNRDYLSEEGIWRDTVAKLPENERAHNNLGYRLSTMPGRLDEAIAQYREALRLKPDYFQGHNNLGAALMGNPGGLDEAVAHFREAIRIRPDFADAHYNLGVALAKMPGHADEAISEYREALRFRPGNADAHYNLGLALGRLPGRLDEAIEQYGEALRLEPDMAQAHNNLGLALSKEPGRMEDAIAEYNEALRRAPDDAGFHINLGDALTRVPGQLGRAVGEFEEALRLDPGSAVAHIDLGIALAKTPGRMADAVAQFGEAVRLDPGSAAAHADLGRALSGIPGRLEEAVAQYREALRIEQGSATNWYHLGVCLLNLGSLSEAEASFRRELLLSPDDPAGKQALEAVLQAEAASH
jgi:tetratricopeptide (TPR) repeat protein